MKIVILAVLSLGYEAFVIPPGRSLAVRREDGVSRYVTSSGGEEEKGDENNEVPSDLKEQVMAAISGENKNDEEGEGSRRKKSGVITLNLSGQTTTATRKKEKAETKKKKKAEQRSRALSRIAEFGLRPREVREHLDRYVVRQEAAKKVLSVAICDHYNVVRRCLQDPREREAEYSKPNILLLGPSGSGKTYIMRTLAKLLGVPFVKADATKFTEAGIVGEDAEDLVRELVQRADNDAELAQYGIIYVDEIDKLCGGGSREAGMLGGSGSGMTSGGGPQRGVQSSFLKIMEDTEVSIHKPFSPELLFGGPESGRNSGPSRISTKHILFIFSGAFTGLDASLRRNREYRGLGFGSTIDDLAGSAGSSPAGRGRGAAAAAGSSNEKKNFSQNSFSSSNQKSNKDNSYTSSSAAIPSARTSTSTSIGFDAAAADVQVPRSYLGEASSADLISAGLEAEFVGRVPVRVAVEQLSARDLEEILQNSEGSVLRQYERDFGGYGIDLNVQQDFIRAIALQAAKENTGARGLVTVLERTFREFKYTLPCAGVDTLICSEQTVADPSGDLALLLNAKSDPSKADTVRRSDVARFAKDLGRTAGDIELSFSPEATASLIAQSKIEDLAVTTLCKKHLGWDILEVAERVADSKQFNDYDDDDDDDDQLLGTDGSNLLLLKVDENGLTQASADDIILDDDFESEAEEATDDDDSLKKQRVIANPVLEALLDFSLATGERRIELPLGLVQDAESRAEVLSSWKRRAAEANAAANSAEDDASSSAKDEEVSTHQQSTSAAT